MGKGIFGPDGKLPSKKKKSDIVDDKVMTPGAPDMYEPDSADVAKIMNYNKGNNDKEVSTDSGDSTKSGVTKGDGMNDNDDGNDVGDSKEDNDEKKSDKVMTPGAPDMYEPDSADVAKIMNYNKGNNDKEVSTDSVDSTKSGVTKGDGMNDNDDGNDVGESKEDNDEKKE